MNYARLQILGACIALFIAPQAVSVAAPSACQNSYFQDQRPDITNEKLARGTVELCSSHFATYYSGVSRTPLWSAEYLTPGRLAESKGLPRSDDFRADMRLPKDMRSTPEDYKKSLDRGHLAPSADMPNPSAVSQSFLMSNMIPQDPQLNRVLWSSLEEATRSKARHQPLYVITGALFLGQQLRRINGRVLVPSHVYKILYDPKENAAAAYLVENAPDKRHKEISLAEIEELAGVRFLPGVTNVSVLKLPRPRYR